MQNYLYSKKSSVLLFCRTNRSNLSSTIFLKSHELIFSFLLFLFSFSTLYGNGYISTNNSDSYFYKTITNYSKALFKDILDEHVTNSSSTENIRIDDVTFSEARPVEICNNNIDDDGDGLIDNADGDCSFGCSIGVSITNVSDCINGMKEVTTEISWGGNGSGSISITISGVTETIDLATIITPYTSTMTVPYDGSASISTRVSLNTGSGSCSGGGSTSVSPCLLVEICDNNMDDDGDGLIDNADPDCANCTTASLNNANFENDFANWTEWNNTSIFTEAISGNKVARITGGQGGFGQDYATSAGEPFTLNFYAKKDSSELASGGLSFYDSNWDKVGQDVTVAVTSSNFKLYSVSAVTPNNTAWIQAFGWKADGSGSAEYDVFCLINANEICGNNLDDDGDGAIDEADNDCLLGCPLTNIYPGFALGTGVSNCSWLDYALANDMRMQSNGDGTFSILGIIDNAIDADWDACTTNPCGLDDAWELNFTLSDKKTWTEWQAMGGTANVHTNCNTQADLDYWDVQGTLTGIGCNAGRTITILGPSSNYRFQIGLGGNSGDGNCYFGLSTWFQAEENGQPVDMDIYAFLDESCYNELTSSNHCYLISDGAGEGFSTPDTFYTFNHTTGAVVAIGETGTLNVEAMAYDTVNQIIYAADGDDFGTIDITTGIFTAITTNMGSLNGAEGNNVINDIDGMTYDYTNNIIWATERSSGTDGLPDDMLLKIDPITGIPLPNGFGAGVGYVTVVTNEHDLDDLAMAADGTLYAISNFGGSGNQRLGTINTTTGIFTEIGDYGIKDVESLTFTATGQLLATTGEDGGQKNSLYSIDAATANATFIGSIEPGHDVEACVCSFGKFSNLQIGDKVWADLNNNGLQEIDEPGLKNVKVNLLDENGNPILDNSNNPKTTTTDVFGNYNFAGLFAGNYIIEFELPAGTSFATKDVGGDDSKDSDADGTTGRTGIITLAGSINNMDADAGILNVNVAIRDCSNDGELFVLDEIGAVLLRYNSTTGALIDTFIQGFIQPMEMIVGDDNYLYISDRGFNQIRRYSLITGAFIDVLARNLSAPVGMTFGADGMLYVNQKNGNKVLKIDPTDGTTTVFITNQLGGLNGNFGGIEFGPDGNLYVSSRDSDEVLRYNGTTGAFIDAFVTAGSGGLNDPDNLTFGSDGNLYVTSSYSDQVKRYNGTTGTFINNFVTYQSGGLQRPLNAVFGSDGNVYVSGHDSPAGIYRYNESTGAYVDLFATGLDAPRGILFAPVPNCDNTTCCSQINYANNSLEEGNFSSFTSSSNPNGTATLTTFGGSDAIDWAPSGGFGTNGSPVANFGANPGYWVDASTNGGLGSIDGDRFYWLEPSASANGSDYIGAVSGSDLLGTFCRGDIVEICGYVATYNPISINGGGAGTDFKFEIYSNNGNDPADFITTPTGTIATDDNGNDNESFTLPLPFSNNVLDITGNTFTGANGQVADWRTLNWQLVCFQIELKEDQSNYSSIVFSMSDGSGGMAIDNLSIRDVSTPNAGKDTTIYSCTGVIDFNDAQSGESWTKVAEPSGANVTINPTTGAATGLTIDGEYKFLLSKTATPTCHDTIRVLVKCPTEICGDNIDNDGDNLIDCADPDCQTINLSSLSFSSCNLNGNQYQATLTVEVEWSNAPNGENIIVAANGTSQTIDLINGVTSPSSVQFTIAADNSQNNPIAVSYSGGSGCGFNSTYNSPSPCPEPTDRDIPCTNASGFVGGIVFEDYDGDAIQDNGEPGLAGILVTAVDTAGSTVGQTNTNNIGVFEFASLTDGNKYRLEFTAIPSSMYPTSGDTYKGTTVQFVASPSCATTLGLIDPTENDCEAANNAILQNGYSIVACLPQGDDVTLAVKDITQLGTLWQTPANRNNNQYSNVPTIRMWETTDFEGEEIFSMTIDPRDGTIYAIATAFYSHEFDGLGTIFNEFVPAKVFKINPVNGNVTRIAQLGGTLGLGYIDFDVVNEQLFITNIDDGKIYRLNTDGVILGSFDPLSVDDGIISQLPALGDRIIGVAFNPIDKRVYYSTWNNHPTHVSNYFNVNNDFNTIRSIGLDENGDFVTATDQLEITLPYNLSNTNGNYLTNPVADIAFNRSGDRMLLSAMSLSESNSTGEISTAAHTSVVREYHKTTNTWTLEPTYGSNNEGKYDIGSQTYYKGRNSRGGVDWAYRSISGDTIVGNDDYILATGDALHINSVEGDFIYGYQFTPSTGGNIANSILVDLDDDVVNADKYIYSDVDIYKDNCANLTLEIGNSVWLDSDSDGVQDPDEVGLGGVKISLFNVAGDSLTSVTSNADGEYYFNENTSGFAGLTPNTDYYLVAGKGGQFNTTNNSLYFVFNLTDDNSGEGSYPDLNDSDAILGDISYGLPANIDGYPVIAIRTGEMGQNNHSFDFGFKEICTPAVALNDSISICPGTDYEGSVAINDSNYDDKTFSVLVQPTDGTVVMNDDGIFKYIGTSSDCTNDQFIYQVCNTTNICCSNATVYLDFNDTERPTLQNVPADDTVSCDEAIPLPSQIFAVDNCPRISLDVKETSTQGEDGCSLYDYTITRTWTAFDQCGNSTSASQIIDVQDVIAPDIYRIYTLPNGKKMVAGVMEFVGENWKIVNLPIDFDTKPIILHQVVTNNDATPVISQIQNTSVSQFELRIREEENLDNDHTRESIAWIAMEAGTQLADYQLEMNSVLTSDAPKVVNFQNNFATLPALFTSSQTTDEEDPFSIRNDGLNTASMTLNLQEERSKDAETSHVNERIGYLAIENVGNLTEEKGVLMGEVGTTTLNGNWTTITLNNTYHNPVIIANSLSNVDGAPATVRIRNVGLNSFQVHVEEWDYLDGLHSNETVSYMVIEGSIPLESPTYCDTGTDSLDVGIDFKAVDNCDVSVVINYTERDTFIGASKIITRTWAAEDECGNTTVYSQEISCEGVSLQLKSVLQGAMLENNGDGLMRDDLRKKGIIPHQEPYSSMLRFRHVASGGGEVMDTTLLAIDGSNGLVDWVFVELRDANDIDNVVATKSALIQCDGDVVTADGDSILLFTNTRIGDYYVAIRHRNHLGMITLETRTFSPTSLPFVDFTFDFTPVVGSNSSVEMDNLESMWSGDLNSDGKVIYQGPNNDIFYMFLHVLQDKGNKDFLPNYISSRYTNDDFNLDGSVIYQGPNNDRARLLFSTILSHPDNPQKFSNFIIYTGTGN